jgi:hypothetical protein
MVVTFKVAFGDVMGEALGLLAGEVAGDRGFRFA